MEGFECQTEMITSSIQLVSELLTDAFNQFITCVRQVHPIARYDEQVSHNAFQITSGSAALNNRVALKKKSLPDSNRFHFD